MEGQRSSIKLSDLPPRQWLEVNFGRNGGLYLMELLSPASGIVHIATIDGMSVLGPSISILGCSMPPEPLSTETVGMLIDGLYAHLKCNSGSPNVIKLPVLGINLVKDGTKPAVRVRNRSKSQPEPALV